MSSVHLSGASTKGVLLSTNQRSVYRVYMLTPRQNASLTVVTICSVFVAGVHASALVGGVCRDPDEPTHPVPVDAPLDPQEAASTPIVAPAAK